MVFSELDDDPDLADLIDNFVEGLDRHVQTMRQALNNSDFELLQREAHQMKGAGGSYGYPKLTEVAKAIEDAAKAEDTEAGTLALGEFAELSQAAARGRIIQRELKG